MRFLWRHLIDTAVDKPLRRCVDSKTNIMLCCHTILNVVRISNVRHDFVTSPIMCFLQASGSVTVADLDISSRPCYEKRRPVPRHRIMFSVGRRGGPIGRRKSARIAPGADGMSMTSHLWASTVSILIRFSATDQGGWYHQTRCIFGAQCKETFRLRRSVCHPFRY